MKTNHYSPKKTAEQGFTLIELSIVLVIIGLIVGGVLVGQDLIKAAETRATISQIEKYNSAVNTFRNKYNGLPGDLINANSTFGFLGGAGGNGDRDGNGFIEGCGKLIAAYGCETAYFWADLSTAGFLDASLAAANASGSTAGALLSLTTTNTSLSTSLPAAKLGKGNYVAVFYNAGYNWFGLGGVTASSGAYTLSGLMTPNQAFNIDKKVDDGAPFTGIVMSIITSSNAATNTAYATGANSATVCAATTSVYNLQTAYGDTPLCAIEMRFN